MLDTAYKFQWSKPKSYILNWSPTHRILQVWRYLIYFGFQILRKTSHTQERDLGQMMKRFQEQRAISDNLIISTTLMVLKA